MGSGKTKTITLSYLAGAFTMFQLKYSCEYGNIKVIANKF